MSWQSTVTRRELMTRLVVGLTGATLASVVAACTSTPPTIGKPNVSDQLPTVEPTVVPTARTEPAPTDSVSPRKGGILRFGSVGNPLTLEGQTIGIDGTNDHLRSVWDQLITIDANQQAQPMLAASWDIADNHQQITFHLRHGVQFHTGRELTAEDVKFSLLRIQDPKIALALTGRMAPMTSVETPDPYTVVVNASRAWVEAFDVLNQATIIDPVTLSPTG